MNNREIQKLLTAFLEPYLKFGNEILFLTVDDNHLRIKTPSEMTGNEIQVRKFTRSDLKFGLSARAWRDLLKEIGVLLERIPKCLD